MASGFGLKTKRKLLWVWNGGGGREVLGLASKELTLAAGLVTFGHYMT
jgi:hypothetical protein